jgi:hypothetical protein
LMALTAVLYAEAANLLVPHHPCLSTVSAACVDINRAPLSVRLLV